MSDQHEMLACFLVTGTSLKYFGGCVGPDSLGLWTGRLDEDISCPKRVLPALRLSARFPSYDEHNCATR